MTNVLIELIEKHSTLENCKLPHHIRDKESRYVLHVDQSFKAQDLQSYINLIKENTELYTFYIEKEIFKTTLENSIRKHNFNLETKILIEFEVEKNKFDDEIDLQAHISFIKVCEKMKCLVVGFYTKNLVILKSKNVKNFTENVSECLKGIRIFSSDDKLQFGFSEKFGLVNLHNFSTYTIRNITALHVNKNCIFYGLNTGEFYEFVNGTSVKLGDLGIYNIISIFTCDNFVYFYNENGEFFKYPTSKNIIEKKKYSVTCAESKYGVIFYGTSSNMLYRILKDEEIGISVEIRYIDYIKIINENLVIISGQYLVQIIMFHPFKVKQEYKFSTEISGLEIIDNEIFISSGSNIYIKNINKL